MVFFDAEGTLYVPRKGKRLEDFWNCGEHSLERAIDYFELNDGVKRTLEELTGRGTLMAVVSVHKDHLLPRLLEHLDIADYFEEIMINGDKGRLMSTFLWQRGIQKESALMVGDTYGIDIEPAKREGIRSLQMGEDIQSIPEVLDHIE